MKLNEKTEYNFSTYHIIRIFYRILPIFYRQVVYQSLIKKTEQSHWTNDTRDQNCLMGAVHVEFFRINWKLSSEIKVGPRQSTLLIRGVGLTLVLF